MDAKQIISLLKEHLSPAAQYSSSGNEVEGVGRKRWTTYKQPSFIAVVKPASVKDVQKVVKLCSEKDIPFHAVATGHHYTTSYEKAKGLLQIDLSNFKKIDIDKSANTVTIGGAVMFKELFDPLFNAGKEMRKSARFGF